MPVSQQRAFSSLYEQSTLVGRALLNDVLDCQLHSLLECCSWGWPPMSFSCCTGDRHRASLPPDLWESVLQDRAFSAPPRSHPRRIQVIMTTSCIDLPLCLSCHTVSSLKPGTIMIFHRSLLAANTSWILIVYTDFLFQ